MKSILPLAVLAALGLGVWLSGLTEYLGWHELARHQASLLALVVDGVMTRRRLSRIEGLVATRAEGPAPSGPV